MLRSTAIAILVSSLLVLAGCDDSGEDGGARAGSDSSASESPTSPNTSAPTPEATAGTSSASPSAPVRHDQANPTVTVRKSWDRQSTCGLLAAQHFRKAGLTVPNPKGIPESDGGCSVDATGEYVGALYGVPPKGEGGEEWPDAKRKYFGVAGNTAYSACDGEIVCQFSVAIGGDRWAVVILMGRTATNDQSAMVGSGRKLLEQLFAELPSA